MAFEGNASRALYAEHHAFQSDSMIVRSVPHLRPPGNLRPLGRMNWGCYFA
jgi:hypothetical protein